MTKRLPSTQRSISKKKNLNRHQPSSPLPESSEKSHEWKALSQLPTHWSRLKTTARSSGQAATLRAASTKSCATRRRSISKSSSGSRWNKSRRRLSLRGPSRSLKTLGLRRSLALPTYEGQSKSIRASSRKGNAPLRRAANTQTA